MANKFVDFTNGTNANDATSFANRVKTIDSSGLTNAKVTDGDFVKIMKSPDPTTMSNTATWTNASSTITLGAAVNKTFDNGSTWTKSANVTGTTGTGKLSSSTNLIIASAFTTGLVAYKDLGSTLDYSAYQQLSLWIKPTINIASGVLRFDLCSDTVGAVPVSQLTINKGLIGGTWNAIVVDLGSAMSSTVRTFALYAISDPGTVTIDLNNMIACKAPGNADELTLYSLLAKSSAPTGNDGWYRPASISTTSVVIDQGMNSAANAARTYEGATATVTTYVRQCIPIDTTATGTFVVIQNGGNGSDSSNIITYSGGWNTTDMSTQTGETFIIDYCNNSGGWNFNASGFMVVEKMGIVGTSVVFNFPSNNRCITINNCWGISNSVPLQDGGTSVGAIYFNNCHFFYSTSSMTALNNEAVGRMVFTNCTFLGSLSSGFNNSRKNHYFKGCIFRNHGTTGLIFAVTDPAEYQLDSCVFGLNGTSDVSFSSTNISSLRAINCTFGSGTKFTLPLTGTHSYLYSQSEGGTAGNHQIYANSATAVISAQATTRHTASGYAWQLSPGANVLHSYYNPLRLKVADVYCTAGTLVTATIWVQRDSTDGVLSFVAETLADVLTSEASVTISASINTWQQLTITFTPAVAGVIPIIVKFWSINSASTPNMYVDDFAVSQA